MGMKRVTKMHQGQMKNDCQQLSKCFKCTPSEIHKLKRLSTLNSYEKAAPTYDFEFEKIIFPKIEEVIHFTMERINYNTPQSFVITQYSHQSNLEQHFLIQNSVTGETVIRFCVRLEYGYNEGIYTFHYSTFEDKFITQYELAGVYWSTKKDTGKALQGC